ncbi:MAG TPA: MFS transporter [Solirubrobacteraceae bacterium]|nr:MFS transporter [Solirubrobacteraceae bacterium]
MRRLALVVGAIVLVDTMFYAAITPLLPRLADELDLGKNGAGVLAAAYAAGTLVGSLPGGWLAARAGVKATVLVGIALMSVSGLAFAFGSSILLLDAARFLQGIGGACTWAGGMAWLSTEAPRERRGEVIGGVLGAAIFGVQLGPVVGALATAIGREAAFSTTVLFGVVLGALAWTLPARPGSEALTTPLAALRERRMVAGMWLTALPAAAFGVMDVLAPLRLDALGATSLALGATFFAAAGTEAIISPTAGRIADRRGAVTVARAGLLIGAVALVVLQLPDTALGLAVTVIFVAGFLGVLWVPAGLLLTAGAERIGLDAGFAFAFFNLGWAGGFTVGAAGGGAIAQASADAVPYLLLAGAYAVTLAVAVRRRPEPSLRFGA